MPRQPRIHKAGAFYHVKMRGVNRENIFFSPEDYCKLCQLIKLGVERFGHTIHAFCFMPNYINLVIQPDKRPLSRIMQHLAFQYATYINQKYTRSGPLFQDRYKALIVKEEYLHELIRFIHLDPLNSGEVVTLEDYIWNGHRGYLGLINVPWLTTHIVLTQFHIEETKARKLYSEYVIVGVGKELPANYYLRPDDKFVEQEFPGLTTQNKHTPQFSVQDLLNTVSEVMQVSLEDLQSRRRQPKLKQGRSMAALIARNSRHLSLASLASFILKDPDYLCKLATDLENAARNESDLANKLEQIMHKLSVVK